MAKVVYIIPGFTEKVDREGYRQIMDFFKSRGFCVVPVKISWKYKVMSDYIDEFLNQFSHKEGDEVSLFGFSFGAMIAFISATRIKLKMLFLCSLSPYFEEDLKFLKKSWKNIVGKSRISDLNNFSFDDLVKKIDCRTFFVVGEKEPKEVFKRVKPACRKVRGSKLFVAKDAKHDISQKEYINKVREIIFSV